MKHCFMGISTLLLAVLVAGCGSRPPSVPLEVGAPVPSLELKSVAGPAVKIDSLRGQIVVLNFWSTSCATCMQEVEELKNVDRTGDVKVVGVALDEDAERVRSVVEKRGIKYPVLLGDQETFERFDGFSIPYTLVLDRSLAVRKRFFGRMSEDDLKSVLASIDQQTQVALNN